MRFLITQLLILMVLCTLLQAQDDDVSLRVSAYGSIPTGDYAEKIGDDTNLKRRSGFIIGENVGLAETGFGLGVELHTAVLVEGLSWVVSARYITNPTDPSQVESKFHNDLGDSLSFSFTTGNWTNIPIMTGFSYSYPFSDNFSAAVLLQAGLNISKAPSRTATVEGITGEQTDFEFVRDLGWEIGITFEIFNQWNVGFSYLDLGSPTFEGTKKLSELVFPDIYLRENRVSGLEYSISMFMVSVGYSFKEIF